MDSLPYATTPLALASLAIIAGVGLLKLIVVGKNNALSRLVTHYGFIVVIMFGILGNAAYLYGSYLASELIVLGSVVDKDGRAIPNVAIDTGGIARGMTNDAGEFVLAIPVSRKNDSYEVTASLVGYEKVAKTVKNGSRMSVRFELVPKVLKASDMVKLSGGEIVVGHYMGLPEIYVAIVVENPSATPLTVNDFLINLTSPSGKVRQLIQVNSAPTMNWALGPPLPQVQVKVGDKFSWARETLIYQSQPSSLTQLRP
ncbi:carboxypeptidase-like regulatory domain-containing protein, partial [Ralstonia solanacearum]|uniref:carboxypeptidase-like regulatory domain-containing protein n=3 Tax=Ralstonia TaxID=48736 RepID=UPI0011AF805F